MLTEFELRNEERKKQGEIILRILEQKNRPLSLEEIFSEYQKYDEAVRVATLLNGVIWELVDLGKADFNSDWRLVSKT